MFKMVSLSQTASGALRSLNDILSLMRELANQSATGTLTSGYRMEIQEEFSTIRRELDSISQKITFNSMKILDGSSSIVAGTDSRLLDVTSGDTHLTNLGEVEGRYLLGLGLHQAKAR